ncbi:MAG: DUF3293 domain-containing protein [Nitriliruptoraceae bacterium]
MSERSAGDPASESGGAPDVRALPSEHVQPDDDASLVTAFERARLISVGVRPLVLFGPRAMDRLPWPGPVWVVTAHNPGGSRGSDLDNDRRHDALVAEVGRFGIDPVEVDAGGPRWGERSLLIASDELDPEGVFALAERFGQHSVFELTDDRIRIVRVRDRRVVSDRPRT